MASGVSGHRNRTGMAHRSGLLRDNRPDIVNSSSKPQQPSSMASPPKHPKSSSPSSSSMTSGWRQSSLASSSSKDSNNKGGVPGRVRVAVRLRPRNAQEKVADMDFADCVELQPEMKRLKLHKNNWDCDTFQFDEVLTETSSQKRVYEVVAKPVVESVCEGYNGTIMAYGQTGTGKTFTLGHLGEKDTASRGIMVRALEDIMVNATSIEDTVSVSYLQLYMERVQDLLAPEKDNMAIVEDPQTRDVLVPGATQVELKDQQSFLQLLQTGEANRFIANTKLNTESSRGHAILLVTVKKVVKPKIGDSELIKLNEAGDSLQLTGGMKASTVQKSKLLIVDLAGSERTEKSGNEGHILKEAKSINLSLTALGKFINALSDNAPHVPIRDSKLTRMLHDSFGGTARTSLILTIGPSPRHRGETTSTIAFGQRVMKVVNMVKLKEEVDYKSLCRKFEMKLDTIMAENERLCKSRQDEREDFERRLEEAQEDLHVAKNSVLATEQKKRGRLEIGLGNATQLLLQKESLEISELKTKLEKETQLREKLEQEVRYLKLGLGKLPNGKGETDDGEIMILKGKLEEEFKCRAVLVEESRSLKEQLMLLGDLCYSVTMGTSIRRSLEMVGQESQEDNDA